MSVLNLHLTDMYRADVLGQGKYLKAQSRAKTVIKTNTELRTEAQARLDQLVTVNAARKGKDYVTAKTIKYLQEILA